MLDDIKMSVDDACTESTRKLLSEKLTHHVLSQDLDDITSSENGTVNANKVLKVLATVKDNGRFRNSIGAVLSIPSMVIERMTGLISGATLLFNQSPRLMLAMICTLLVARYIQENVQQLQWWCVQQSGFDKNSFEGYHESQDISTSIENFEDMRIAAKEHVIIQQSKSLLDKKKMEMLRARLIPDMFRPFRNILSDVPALVGAYVGGLLATRNSGISPADLGGFTTTAANLLRQFDRFYYEIKELYSLKHSRFTKGLEIVEMFESKPKCGIEGGWKPPAAYEESIVDKKKMSSATMSQHCATKEDCVKASLSSSEKSVDQLALEMLGPKEHRLKGRISFKNVTFKYKGKQKNMLKGVSFDIPAGSSVGICGESGAGKSTMFKLLLRLHEVRSGSIEIDGKPLQYYNPVYLRSQFGLAKQNPTIFKYESIRDNVLYGKKHLVMKMGGPLAADKFVKRALVKASAWTKFQNRDKFPLGIDSDTKALSGGEQQRIGIARALLLTSPILLCDELTSGLDAVTADIVLQNVVANRPPGQTVISVAHKLSTIKDADMIILVREDGTIETGTFEELSSTSTKFKNMRKAQELGSPEEANTNKKETTTRANGDLRSARNQKNNNDDGNSKDEGFFKKMAALRHQICRVDTLPVRMARALERACDEALRHQGEEYDDVTSRAVKWKPYARKTEDAMFVERMKREAIKMGKLARTKSNDRRGKKRSHQQGGKKKHFKSITQ